MQSLNTKNDPAPLPQASTVLYCRRCPTKRPFPAPFSPHRPPNALFPLLSRRRPPNGQNARRFPLLLSCPCRGRAAFGNSIAERRHKFQPVSPSFVRLLPPSKKEPVKNTSSFGFERCPFRSPRFPRGQSSSISLSCS